MADEVLSITIDGDASGAQAAAASAASAIEQFAAAVERGDSATQQSASAAALASGQYQTAGQVAQAAGLGFTQAGQGAQQSASGVNAAGSSASTAGGNFGALQGIVGALGGAFSTLGGGAGQVISVLSSAASTAQQTSQAMSGMGGSMASIAGPAGAAAAAIAVVTAASVGAGVAALKNAQDMATMAERFNTTAGEIRALTEGMKEVEAGGSAVQAMMQKFTSIQAEMTKGISPAAQELKKLGVEVRDSNGDWRDGAEMAVDYIEALSKIPDSSERTVQATKLLGSSLGPVIAQMAGSPEAMEKMERGLGSVDAGFESTQKQLGEYQDAQEQLGKSMENFGNTVAPIVVAGMKAAAGGMEAAASAAKILIDLFEKLTSVGGVLGGGLMNSVLDLAGVGSNQGNILSSGFASGTSFAPGGLSLVGERGPEIVNLPRGAEVFTAHQTAAMSGSGGGSVNVINFHFDTVVGSYDELERRITTALGNLSRRGITFGGA